MSLFIVMLSTEETFAYNDQKRIQHQNDEYRALLWAIHQQEASGQENPKSRFEPKFYERYLKDNPKYGPKEKKYGKRAIASSYGPWQIMYSTAVQMGYKGSPEALRDPSVSLPYVKRYLRWLASLFDGNLEKMISAYNAGPGGVGTNPQYTKSVQEHLQRWSAREARDGGMLNLAV